nr:hypothetical protein [uncultured Prevotella sp.]
MSCYYPRRALSHNRRKLFQRNFREAFFLIEKAGQDFNKGSSPFEEGVSLLSKEPLVAVRKRPLDLSTSPFMSLTIRRATGSEPLCRTFDAVQIYEKESELQSNQSIVSNAP